jgi:hypothetical protein
MQPHEIALAVFGALAAAAIVAVPIATVVPQTVRVTSMTYASGLGDVWDAYLAGTYALYEGTYNKMSDADAQALFDSTSATLNDPVAAWALDMAGADTTVQPFLVLDKLANGTGYRTFVLNDAGTPVCFTAGALVVPNPGLYATSAMSTALSTDAGTYAVKFSV